MSTQISKSLFFLFSLLALGAMACALGSYIEPAGTEPPAGIAGQEEEPDQPAPLEVEPAIVAEALLNRYDLEGAFVALMAAMERGYTPSQYVDASLSGRLEPDGSIVDADGELVPPAGPSQNVIDLSTLEAALAGKSTYRGRQEAEDNAAVPCQDPNLTNPTIHTVMDCWVYGFPFEQGERELARIIALSVTGYSIEQIVDWIIFADSVAFVDETCTSLQTPTGEVVPPALSHNPICVQELEKRNEENSAVLPDGEAAQPGVDTPGGDVEEFCRRYGLMSDALQARAEAIADAIAACGTAECDNDALYEALEDTFEEHLDDLVEPAPEEIRPVIEQLAADTMRGITSSEGRPELEPLLAEMEKYAGEACGIRYSDE